jgi:hypothetical protein
VTVWNAAHAARLIQTAKPSDESAPVAEAPRSWLPVYRCCWCGHEFIQRHVDGTKAWVCPTEKCYLRQIKWKILDEGKQLFYLPMPRLVEVEEAVASLRYGALCLGGDRAGGKSVGLKSLIYRYCRKIPNFSALILRRNFPELELNFMRFAPTEAPRLGASWSEAKKLITFYETGATVKFGHCWKPKDYAGYIGGDVDLIMFGQLEQFTQKQFQEISPSAGRIRRDNWRGLVLAEENPGGPLSEFVNEFFIKKAPNPKDFPHYNPDDHHFIKSQLDDNPWCDPRYVNKLANMSYARREMFRYGRRDIFEGQFFPGWDITKHVTQ